MHSATDSQQHFQPPLMMTIDELLVKVFKELMKQGYFVDKTQKSVIGDSGISFDKSMLFTEYELDCLFQGRMNNLIVNSKIKSDSLSAYEKHIVFLKKYWLDKAVRFILHKARIDFDTQSPGTLIYFLNTSLFYKRDDVNSLLNFWGNSYALCADGRIVYNVKDEKTTWNQDTDFGYTGHGDIAMIVKDVLVAKSLVFNKKIYSGQVNFYRLIDILLTRHSDAASIPLPEPEVINASLLMNPGKITDKSDLFIRHCK